MTHVEARAVPRRTPPPASRTPRSAPRSGAGTGMLMRRRQRGGGCAGRGRTASCDAHPRECATPCCATTWPSPRVQARPRSSDAIRARSTRRRVAAAVIESVAENTRRRRGSRRRCGALAAGAPVRSRYRAVNTMDAMVGHHSARYERFGWAARAPRRRRELRPRTRHRVAGRSLRPRSRRTRSGAPSARKPARTPHPNAGVAEAAFAAALGCELGGPLRYGGSGHEDRPGWAGVLARTATSTARSRWRTTSSSRCWRRHASPTPRAAA